MKWLVDYICVATVFIFGMSACGGGPEKGPDNPIPPAEKYAITFPAVQHGSAVATLDGAVVTEAEKGKTITIEARVDEVDIDSYEFGGWVVVKGDVELADDTKAKTTFTMPAEAVELKAEFAELPADVYPIILKDSEKGVSEAYVDGEKVTSAAQGTVITIEAVATDTNCEFDVWTVVSENVELDDASQATTTFTMPAEAVELKAEFTEIPPELFRITLEETVGGTFSAYVGGKKVTEALSGTVVEMGAIPSAPVNGTEYEFAGWSITGATISPEDNTRAYFTMPRNDVSVKANFRERVIAYYNVNCEQTTGGTVKAFKGQEEVMRVEAYSRMRVFATPEPGYNWVRWDCSSNVRLDNSMLNDPATFQMPAEDVTIRAVFEKIVRKITITTAGGGTAQAQIDGVKVTRADPGASITLVAVPQISNTNGDYVFVGWSSPTAGVIFSPNSRALTATFVMPDRDVAILAQFERKVPTGSSTPDERFIGTWKDETSGSTVEIGATTLKFRTSDGKGYNLGGMKWNAVNNEGEFGSPTLADEYPTGCRLEAGNDGGGLGILPWREDGRGGAMGDIAFEWWYINADGTALMPGRNPTEASGGKGPYIKQ